MTRTGRRDACSVRDEKRVGVGATAELLKTGIENSGPDGGYHTTRIPRLHHLAVGVAFAILQNAALRDASADLAQW